MLQAGDTLYVHDGTYTNPGFSETHGEDGDLHHDNPVLVALGISGQDDTWTRIAAYPDGNDVKPLLRIDGEVASSSSPAAVMW